MKNLFEAARVEEVKERIARLRTDSQRQWGKMNAAQAVAHCSAGLELAVGTGFRSGCCWGGSLADREADGAWER